MILKKIKGIRIQKRTIRLGLLCGAGASLIGAVITGIVYTQTPVAVQYDLEPIPVERSLRVDFNQEVSPDLNYNVTPALPGHWETHRGILGITGIEFHPTNHLQAGSKYQLAIGHVVKLGAWQSSIDNKTLIITTESPADLKSITPADGAHDVETNPVLSVKLKSANHGLRKLSLTSDAPFPLQPVTAKNDAIFSWKFETPLPQGATYHLYLDDLNQSDISKRRISTSTFTTVAEPKVSQATQTDHLYPDDKVQIIFDQTMKPDKSPSFDAPGSGSWINPTTYQFAPTGLARATTYHYRIHKGASSVAGGIVEADHEYAFATPGAVFVTASSPSSKNAVLSTTINFAFDQPVDHASAQAAFSISPSVAGTFSWSGNTMIFKPAGLGYQTNYTASLNPGVASTFGLPSNRTFSTSFATTYEVIRLSIPYFHQAYSLSCEAAALRMILAFRGIDTNDYDIMLREGYNPRPRDTATNSWDNPYEMFVGDINGSQGTTGWGVYAPPVTSAAQSYGRSASTIMGISANQVAQSIHDGNPVIVWGYSGSKPIMDGWNTPSGPIQVARNEHARTVTGVAGSPANPIGFYINDPYFGQFYWTTAQLIANMTANGQLGSQGVVVR